MSSAQEQIVTELAAHSMGAPYIFAPRNYRKGPAEREPVDLAWACNNCVILMNMTGGGRTYAQKVAHNLKQLKGWLRAWSLGQSLCGENTYRSYAIPFDAYRHVVLLSVVDGADAQAEFHHDAVAAFSRYGSAVVGCVTIPEAVLSYLARNGGSTRDLVEFLDIVRRRGSAFSGAEALAIVVDRHRKAIATASTVWLRSDIIPNPQLEQLTTMLMGLRVQTAGILKTSGDAQWAGPAGGDLPSIMNDLQWEGAFSIAACMDGAVQQLDSVPPGAWGVKSVTFNHAVHPYRFVVAVIRTPGPDLMQSLDVLKNLPGYDDEQYPPTLLIATVADFGIALMIGEQVRIGPSATELKLDTWRSV